MTDSELFQFNALFDSLRKVFPLRGEEHELRDVMGSYFKAFRSRQLKDLAAGMDRWIVTGKRFPKPAEWLEAIPRQNQRAEVPKATEEELRAYLQAEQMRWEDLPCGCGACLAVGVQDKPLRFVPDIETDGRDRRRLNSLNERVFVTGHWAHGDELARWYAARGSFWNAYYAAIQKSDMNRGKKRPKFNDKGEQVFTKPKKLELVGR